MKKVLALVIILTLVCAFMAACGGSSSGGGDYSLVGVWEYADEENGIGAVYDLKDDGTGTYTMAVGEEEVTYELKYELKDGHLLVSYVNNDIFSEDDVFDNEFRFVDENTFVVKDTAGEELTFVKQ